MYEPRSMSAARLRPLKAARTKDNAAQIARTRKKAFVLFIGV
jgi:hypothetical protein